MPVVSHRRGKRFAPKWPVLQFPCRIVTPKDLISGHVGVLGVSSDGSGAAMSVSPTSVTLIWRQRPPPQVHFLSFDSVSSCLCSAFIQSFFSGSRHRQHLQVSTACVLFKLLVTGGVHIVTSCTEPKCALRWPLIHRLTHTNVGCCPVRRCPTY